MSNPPRKRLKPGEKVLLSLTGHQVGLIIEHLPISEGLLSTLHHSRVWDGVVKIRCTLDELSELAGIADANNTTDMQLQQSLAAVASAIAKVEQQYWVRPRLVSVVGKG